MEEETEQIIRRETRPRMVRSETLEEDKEEEEEEKGKEEKEEEEEELQEELRRRCDGGGGGGKKEDEDAHINTYATQTKTHKGPRSRQIRSCGMQIRAY